MKALRVPALGVSNSLSCRWFCTNESNRVGQVDGIVLRVCYAGDHSGRLKGTSYDDDNFRDVGNTSHQ